MTGPEFLHIVISAVVVGVPILYFIRWRRDTLRLRAMHAKRLADIEKTTHEAMERVRLQRKEHTIQELTSAEDTSFKLRA